MYSDKFGNADADTTADTSSDACANTDANACLRRIDSYRKSG